MEQDHLNYLDVNDAFILRYGNRMSVLHIAQTLGISCEEVNERYDNLFFIHIACQTKIDKEYHKRCAKLLRSFPPAVQLEGLNKKKVISFDL